LRRIGLAGSVRWAIVAVAALCVTAPAAAAVQSARVEVQLVPERLGQGTTVEFGFTIARVGGGVPSPVVGIDLFYPKHLGLVTSGLGIASCTHALLQEFGAEHCPSQSLMGYGTATAEVAVPGGEVVRELASTAIFMAPLAEGNINLQFLVEAETPLVATLVFSGALLPAAAPYGGDLAITVPLFEGLPETGDVALVKLRSTIGPLGITYYARVHGGYVPYHPDGITLPKKCPTGGFPFAIAIRFADGTSTTSRVSVACPRSGRAGRV
jgi:hypothetical protein